MKTLFTTREIKRTLRITLSAAFIAMLALACASPVTAQKDKKKKISNTTARGQHQPSRPDVR
jgi:hypothetical protein